MEDIYKVIRKQDLNETRKQLLDSAFSAMEFAYNPYSNFYVGAALLDDEGKIFTGCNIENASFSLVTCAERTAVFKAVSEGSRRFQSIAIVSSGGKSGSELPAGPCGACRQVISEFASLAGKNIEIILASEANDEVLITSIYELLPLSFGPDSLIRKD